MQSDSLRLLWEDIGVIQGIESSVGLIKSEIEVLHDLTLFLSFTLTVCDQILPHAFRHPLSWWAVRDLGDSRDSNDVVLLPGLVRPTHDLVSASGQNPWGHALKPNCQEMVTALPSKYIWNLDHFSSPSWWTCWSQPLLICLLLLLMRPIFLSQHVCPKPSNGPHPTQSKNKWKSKSLMWSLKASQIWPFHSQASSATLHPLHLYYFSYTGLLQLHGHIHFALVSVPLLRCHFPREVFPGQLI